jgi:4-hydroxythreonine-4-phosphate dehydrogenase
MRIGISIGDLNGVGPEVVMKTLSEPNMMNLCTPVIYASQKSIQWWRKTLKLDHFNFTTINQVEQAQKNHINVINVWEEDLNITPGKELPVTGQYAVKSFQAACKDLADGKIACLVTAPISKKNTLSNEFPYNGHTDYLAKLFGKGDSLMMMISDSLKVGLVTVHVPVQDISKNLSADKIYKKIDLLYHSLQQDFGLTSPKIAVLGLNPHAGEGGTIGNEEQQFIIPAIQKAKEKKMVVMGPFSADGFFGSGKMDQFDAVLAMYHDQGLVPFKALSFGNGTNYTAGLSVTRTSPDHGTGFDIAGTGVADESSFRTALFHAIDIARNKASFAEANANPLKRSVIEVE